MLKNMPDGLTLRKDSRVLPCDDDDGIGRVGWNATATFTGESAIRDYYKRTLPAELGASRRESE